MMKREIHLLPIGRRTMIVTSNARIMKSRRGESFLNVAMDGLPIASLHWNKM